MIIYKTWAKFLAEFFFKLSVSPLIHCQWGVINFIFIVCTIDWAQGIPREPSTQLPFHIYIPSKFSWINFNRDRALPIDRRIYTTALSWPHGGELFYYYFFFFFLCFYFSCRLSSFVMERCGSLSHQTRDLLDCVHKTCKRNYSTTS